MTPRSISEFAAQKLRSLERRHLKRSLVTTDRIEGLTVDRGGRHLVSFSCNDYLGLATDPATIAAAVEATREFGTGAGASRLITGSHSLYRHLEQKLATIKAAEDAVVFGSGYLANIGIVPLFAGKPDLVLIDELAHSSLLAGAALSSARVVQFAHNDASAAASVLNGQRGKYRHCLILTEGVFSMDGDLAPLPDLSNLAEEYDAWLMTDDAHGLGVVGRGRGSSFAFPLRPQIPLQMGTLSKAVGAYGGYVCASASVCELIRNRAKSFVYSTGLPPATVAAATTALEIIERDAERVARPLALARRFCRELELPEAQSAIVPLIIGDNMRALEYSDRLQQAGFLVTAIRPPTVPAGTARLRLTFSASHTDADVTDLIEVARRQQLVRA